jgi:hypothetical protein
VEGVILSDDELPVQRVREKSLDYEGKLVASLV